MTKLNTFGKLKKSLGRNFVYNLQTFRDFVKWFLRLLLQIQHENNFLPTSKHWQGKFRRFCGILFFTVSFLAQIRSSENVLKWDDILASVAKQWIAKDILSYGSQSKCVKIAIHWFGKY